MKYIINEIKKNGINRIEERETPVARIKIRTEIRRRIPIVVRITSCDRFLSQ
jgi:hypothetical protein